MKNFGVVTVFVFLAALLGATVYFGLHYDAAANAVGAYPTIGQVPPKELGMFIYYTTMFLIMIKFCIDILWSLGEAVVAGIKDA